MARKLRKRYQRALNHAIRDLNKNIAEDNLWKGRFYFFQKDARWEEFPDGSGGILHAYIRGYDKATGYYRDCKIEYAPFLTFANWHIWDFGNQFIVEDVRVWDEIPRPSITAVKDWTKVPVDTQKVGKFPFNFWWDIRSVRFSGN
jgi:hypothetical protein